MKLNQVITKTIVGFPKLTILFFLLLSIAAIQMIPGLERDPTPYLLPPSHESRVNLATLRQNFTGANDGILILLEADKSVFTLQTLSRVEKLTRAFENIHLIDEADREALLALAQHSPAGIAEKIRSLGQNPIDEDTWMLLDEIKEELSPFSIGKTEFKKVLDQWSHKLSPIVEVTSLANTDNILGREGKLDVNPIFDHPPRTKQELLRVEQDVRSNEIFDNLLFSNGGRCTSIVIEVALKDDEADNKYLLYNKIKDIVEQKIPGDEVHYIAGLPATSATLGKMMQQDIRRLFPIVIIIVITCLFIAFRKMKGIFVPLVVVILTLIVTLGIKSLFKVPFNIITTTLPVFILSIGVADGIHMFSEYRDNLLKGYDKIKAVSNTLAHLTMPVVMTSFTTAAAFLAIAMTEIVQIRHFGIFVAVGTLVAMVFSLLFIPALLVLLPEKKRIKKQTNSKIDALYIRILVNTTNFFVNRPIMTAVVAGLVFVVSLFGASKVLVNTNTAKYFLKSSSLFISSEKLNTDAAGSSVINFLVSSRAREDQPFKNPENLKHVEGLSDYLKAQPLVGKVMGLTELIKRINLALHDEDPRFNKVPTVAEDGSNAKNLISQLLLLYENGGGDTLSDYTDLAYTHLNIPVVLKTNSSLDIYRLSNLVKTYVNTHFPDHLKMDISGSASVIMATTKGIVYGQVISLIVSLVVVLIMLFFTFRKFSQALIGVVPFVMTISINFGIMGFFSIPLDVGSAVISSIVIGIGVDYSIHYLSRLKRNLARGMQFSEALNDTVIHSGKAIVFNAFTVGFGFIALWFSLLNPLITMGWMITVTMMVSAATTLILIPVLVILVTGPARLEIKETAPPALELHPHQAK